jgi:DNA-binding NtrC family response regulator
MAMNMIKQANKPANILVVDDDQDMLQLLAGTIRNRFGNDALVKAVDSPTKACDILEANLIDVMVTDLQMPGMSGLQLLRCAKRRNAWTQVVVVTGHSEMESLTYAMDLGASDYLTKPLDPEEFEKVLSEAITRLRRWQRSLAKTLVAADLR